MATVERPTGVRITAPETFSIESQPGARRGPVDLPTGPVPLDGTDTPDLSEALRDAEFEIVDRVELTPTSDPTPETGVRRRGAPSVPADQPVEVAVDVPPGQEAVVLVEQDGVYSWVLPSESGAAATRGAGTRTFDLSLQSSVTDQARTRGFIDDLIYSKATALVLRFVAPPLGRAAISHFEKVEEGLVQMVAEGPSQWRHVQPEDLSLPAGGRILLFVHGTFSSTSNSFGPLWQTEEGRRLLATANDAYDLVLGVDHRTLSLDPLQNAQEIVRLLAAIPGGTGVTVDALGYSRGGLVLRSVIERVTPDSGWDATFGRAAFVGVTHHGTILASPKHWNQLIDLYTNLIVAGANGLSVVVPGAAAPSQIISASLKVIGAAVKALAAELIDKDTIPGLAAMEPDGEFVASINEPQASQPGSDVLDYFAITSNFDADEDTGQLPSRLKFILKDGLMDRLMGEDNDLVVNTASMTATEPGYLKDTWEFGTNGTVFHTNYFQQAQVADALSRWWDLVPAASAAPPPPPSTPPPPAAAPPPVRRTRGGGGAPPPPSTPLGGDDSGPVEMSFSAGMDKQVTLGETASVEVRIGDDEISAELWAAETGRVDVGVPIIVELKCRSGFKPEGEKRITVEPPTGETLVRYFDVTATDLGPGQIDVVFRQGQVPILTLSVKPEVVAGAPTDVGETRGEGTARAAEALAVPLHQLRISERMTDGKIVYDFDFESETLGVLIAATSKPLQVDRVDYVAKLFTEIENRWVGSGQDADNFRQELRAYGASLFDELVPPEIQAAMWEHRDQITAIQVLSTEPFIPWEIVHLKEPGGSLTTEEHFLGAKGLVRWLHGSWPPAKIRVRPDRVRAVIPAYPAGTNYQLPEAEAEMAFLSETFRATPVEPTTKDVRDLIAQPGAFDLLHFAGHGTADQSDVGNARIMMQGRVENNAYVPEYLNATTVGEFGNLADSEGNRPIVVLNACQVGRAGYQLTSIGGFAAAFTKAGAGAFVSSLWSVGDHPARTFTETWYRQLLDGKSVTDATIAARQAAADAKDATWLAYTVYAHPHAVIVPV